MLLQMELGKFGSLSCMFSLTVGSLIGLSEGLQVFRLIAGDLT